MANWLDPWRDATVAIGRLLPLGDGKKQRSRSKKQQFQVVGTGVIFVCESDPKATPWLVTAKHVFQDPPVGWNPSHLSLRFSWHDETGTDGYLGLQMDLKHMGKRQWLSHPQKNVDLACLPLRIPTRRMGIEELPSVRLGDLGTTQDIDLGAPVIILGYPGPAGPGFGPRAMVRQGIVSWVSRTKPKSSVFLIDGHVFPGNSGGPVFTVPIGPVGNRLDAKKGGGALLGIVTQARVQNMPLMAGGKEIEIKFKGEKTPETLFAPSFMGIGQVEPVFRVNQLLRAASKSAKR